MNEKIIAIGNSLMDISVQIPSDAVLKELNLPKGSMQLVDEQAQGIITAATADLETTYTPGGSAANTARGLARLGSNAAFMGTVGHDQVGENFIEALFANSVIPKIFRGQLPSGRCVALVSPDTERTMATYLGAATELCAENIDISHFEEYGILHIEGYLIINRELMLRLLRVAKESKMKISLDLASYNVVDDNRDFILEILPDYIDILFANEQEALSLTGLEPEGAVNAIAKMCDIAVVKVGAEGSLVKHNGKLHHIAAYKAAAVDTTAAGDIYAAGFLHGLSRGLNMDRCGDIGSFAAAKVIEVTGTTLSGDCWAEIRAHAI